MIHFLVRALVVAMPLITASFSFLLVGVLGNLLVQRWQQRNWIEQQRLLRAEKRLDELKRLSDDLMKLGDSRSYRTRRLLLNLASIDSNTLDSSEYLIDYKIAVGTWNDSFNSYCTRLTLYANWGLSGWLENVIQPKFYKISERLEVLVKVRRLNGLVPVQEKNLLNGELNSINASLGKFYRQLLELLLRMQKEAYIGREVNFNSTTIEQFSTWYLLKALLQAEHPPVSVFSSLSDFS